MCVFTSRNNSVRARFTRNVVEKISLFSQVRNQYSCKTREFTFFRHEHSKLFVYIKKQKLRLRFYRYTRHLFATRRHRREIYSKTMRIILYRARVHVQCHSRTTHRASSRFRRRRTKFSRETFRSDCSKRQVAAHEPKQLCGRLCFKYVDLSTVLESEKKTKTVWGHAVK